MNRLGQRILAAPVGTRRAAGIALLLALASSFGIPASAQTRAPEHFAGSSECANVETGDQGVGTAAAQIRLHGQSFGVQMTSAGGTVYVGDIFVIRAVSPPGAATIYAGDPEKDIIRGVAVGDQGVVWVDTGGPTVQIRTLAGTLDTGLAVNEATKFLEHGIAVGGDGVYFASPVTNKIYKVGSTGLTAVPHGPLDAPGSLVAAEEAGKTVLYVAGKGSPVMRVDPVTGDTTPVGGTLRNASVPARITIDPVERQLFVADVEGLSQIDLPTEPTKSTLIYKLPGGQITGLAVRRSTPQSDPLVVFANQGVPTGEMRDNPFWLPGHEVPRQIPVDRCDIQSVVPNDPVPPTTTSTPTSVPTTPPSSVPDTTPTTIPKLDAPAGQGTGAPTGGGEGGGESVTDPSQLTGTRAEGDFGQFNPMANTTGGSNSSSFVPFASGGGQGFGGFASAPAATDPFSGGGAFAGGGAGPGETVAAAAGAPPASVANPGPVGAAVPPPPAATPIAAGSPTPVQGWAGAPGEPAQGATRYAMVAQEGGGDLLVYGLLGIGGCCLLLGIGAGTRRGGKAPARAAASAPAKAWAVGP